MSNPLLSKKRGRPRMTEEEKRLSALKRAAERMRLAQPAALIADSDLDEHYLEALRNEGKKT